MCVRCMIGSSMDTSIVLSVLGWLKPLEYSFSLYVTTDDRICAPLPIVCSFVEMQMYIFVAGVFRAPLSPLMLSGSFDVILALRRACSR